MQHAAAAAKDATWGQYGDSSSSSIAIDVEEVCLGSLRTVCHPLVALGRERHGPIDRTELNCGGCTPSQYTAMLRSVDDEDTDRSSQNPLTILSLFGHLSASGWAKQQIWLIHKIDWCDLISSVRGYRIPDWQWFYLSTRNTEILVDGICKS